MPAIQIKSPALTLKAGRRALARIRERGLQPTDVGIVPGAAGGQRRWASRDWTWRSSASGCRAPRANAR